MALIVISVDRTELPAHSDEEFEEWARFMLGDTGSMDAHNPLSAYDIEAEIREISL